MQGSMGDILPFRPRLKIVPPTRAFLRQNGSRNRVFHGRDMKKGEEKRGDRKKSDEITEWLTKNGRKTLDLEAARQLASESPELWYIALQGSKGYIVGKMTMQKYSARHILVDKKEEPIFFLTADAARRFLLNELNVQSPHVFNV